MVDYGNGDRAGGTVVLHIRTRKEDSAFVYAVLEAHEGIASYSTLDCPKGAPYRDLELVIPAGLEKDVDQVLAELGGVIVEKWKPDRSGS